MSQKPHLYITVPGSFETGGVGRQVQYLTNWLEETDSAVVTLLNTRGTGSVLLSPFYLLRSMGQLLLAPRKSAVVHINLASYASTVRKYFLLSFAKALGFPVVLHLHGAEYRQFYGKLSPFWQARIRGMYKRADTVVVLGALWKEFVIETLGVAPEKVQVIANAVPSPALPKTEIRPPLILFLGRLGERKGTADLLQALSMLPPDLAWQAVMAGDGDVAHFQAQAETLGLSTRVHFTGWIAKEKAAEYLTQASIFTLPSYNEGLPMAVLEALSYGVPVVTTPVGSLPDAIEDGKNGRMVQAGDVPALAAAFQQLLTDSALRQRLSLGAAATYQQRYTLEGCGEAFMRVYTEIVSSYTPRV